MAKEMALPPLIDEKLAAFERLQPEFESSFQYVQEVQGQRRFPALAVDAAVRYLHALWVCECKDRLLSVPRTIGRYEGRRCLELLRDWQAGMAADVVNFLQRKLDTLPFADITRQLEAIQQQGSANALAERLAHGRMVLLNRGMNLLHALDPLFSLPVEKLVAEVRAACARYGHQPDQIAEQLAELEAARYAYTPHPALARRNMLIMDQLGVRITADDADQPGRRSWRVAEPTLPASPYAQQVIAGYVDMTSLRHNNFSDYRFIYHPDPENTAAQQ